MKHPALAGTLTAVVLLAILILSAWCYGALKAAAYERVTGRSIDAWDALILDLKVHH